MFTQYKLEEVGNFYSENYQLRYNSLIQRFQQIFKNKPEFIARAPGRVNIIGEHIDYQGYGVFPSAIEKDCLIAVKATQLQSLQIHHFDQDNYPNHRTSNNPNFSEKYPNKYFDYFLAGYRAAVEKCENKKLVGMQVLITGNVPIGSGVSSSSSLVVCSALATYYANKLNGTVKVEDFIESCIRRQRQCGLAGGGMDQTISVMGKLESCLYIQFNPIRCERVHVPSGCKLIIMNSLVQNLKVNSAIYRYNKRVVQCRLGLYLFSINLGIKQQIYKKWKVLKQLQEYLNLSVRMTSSLVQKMIQRKTYTKKDIEQKLGQNIWMQLSDIQRYNEVLQANQTYNLFEAVKHVFQQSQRVLDLIQLCKSTLTDHTKNIFFGKLMNQSHFSCKNLYNCSCQELDELTQLALKHGALGSRLTGAGWGGCTVSLVQNQKVHQFIQYMKNTYYSKQPFKQRAQEHGIQNVIFESKPCQGACIVLL